MFITSYSKKYTCLSRDFEVNNFRRIIVHDKRSAELGSKFILFLSQLGGEDELGLEELCLRNATDSATRRSLNNSVLTFIGVGLDRVRISLKKLVR